MKNQFAPACRRVNAFGHATEAPPPASNVSTVSMRCLSERPNRSSRQTTRVSPVLNASRSLTTIGTKTYAKVLPSPRYRNPNSSKQSFTPISSFCIHSSTV